MIDEGPSSEDLERFGDDTAHCPECGDEIWDQAEFCPSCGAHVSGGTLSRTPEAHGVQQRWVAAVAIILAILLSGIFVIWRML